MVNVASAAGPAGLSAGLFTGKMGSTRSCSTRTGRGCTRHTCSTTPNRLGGSEFLTVQLTTSTTARQQAAATASSTTGRTGRPRARVDRYQARRSPRSGRRLREYGDGFVVTTEADEYEADYVVLATGASRDLAESLGCEFDGDLVDVGVSMETSVEGAYATGAMVRAEGRRSSRPATAPPRPSTSSRNEKGEHYHDFDVPDTATSVFGGLIDDE